MKLHAFGVRGSLPSPSTKGFKTSAYGGNTTCYYLEVGPFRIILDMGSGARPLGNLLMSNGVIGKSFIFLLTHYHSDHTQGIGFFVPLYIKANTFHIHGFTPDERRGADPIRNIVLQCLEEQQSSPYFPVPHVSLPAEKLYQAHDRMFSEVFYYLHRDGRYMYISEKESAETKSADPKDVAKVTTIPLNHPNGCIGYRIDYTNKSLAFCTDSEPLAFTNDRINTLCKDVDLIVLDGQYTAKQLRGQTQTFGHGTPELCVDQAVACGAKRLLITHFDPGHDDAKLKEMEETCIAYLAKQKKKTPSSVEFAREGRTWEI